jgi:transposase-like protein
MPTPPKHPREMARPRRKVGVLLSQALSCPVCHGDVKPVRYGVTTAKMRCETCNVHFSIDAADIACSMHTLGFRRAAAVLAMLATYRPSTRGDVE